MDKASTRNTVWVFKPIATGNKNADAPKEVEVGRETFLGRNPECGIQNIHLSRCQVSASAIPGDNSKIRVRHMGKFPSFIVPRSSGLSETATRFADGAETFLNIGDKLSLLEGAYTYVLTKKVVSAGAASGGNSELKRREGSSSSSSSLSGSLERTPSEMCELQDMIDYSLSLSGSASGKKAAGKDEKADTSKEIAGQLSSYFPHRSSDVINAASKLCADISSAANMLLNKTDEEILAVDTDGYFAQLRDIVGDEVDSETIGGALALCDFDVERAMNKILADRSEAEQASKYAEKENGALKRLREMYPGVDVSVIRVAIEASGGDLATAAELISADASVSGSKSPSLVEKKKPRIGSDKKREEEDDDDIEVIGVDSDWAKYAKSDSVKLLKGKFPGVSEKKIFDVLRACGEDVAFAEKTLRAEARPQPFHRPKPPKAKAAAAAPLLGSAVDSDMSPEEMLFVLKSDPAVNFLDDDTLREGLKATRNKGVGLAKRWIFADPDEKAALEQEVKVLELRQMFPDTEDKALRRALAEHNGNLERTLGFLFGDVSMPKDPVSRAPPAVPLAADVDQDAFKHLRTMFPHKQDREILDALTASNNDIEFATDFLVKGVQFANYEIHEAKDIDPAVPCQSVSGLGARSLDQVIRPPGGINSNYIRNCFLTMLKREQDFHKDYFVFYHSYSFAHIVYELNSVLAPLAYPMVSKDFPPLPRLLLGPFSGMPELEMLVERFKSMTSKDHDAEYRKLAISVSTSLFAFSSEAPPTKIFVSGYSCTDLNFRDLIRNNLAGCRVPANRIEPLTDAVVEVGKKYGLNVSMFARQNAGIGAPLVPQAGGNFGHMLQIFVHKEYVDAVAYSSLPYGVPTGKLLSDCLSRGDADGQARIFMNPELFTDITKTRIFYYSSNETFFYKRRQLADDLRNALRELFDNADMAQNAKQGILGI